MGTPGALGATGPGACRNTSAATVPTRASVRVAVPLPAGRSTYQDAPPKPNAAAASMSAWRAAARRSAIMLASSIVTLAP